MLDKACLKSHALLSSLHVRLLNISNVQSNYGKEPLPRNNQDRVLWTLTEHGGSMAKSDLDRRLQTRQTELDIVLQELERAGKIKLTEIKGNLVVGLKDGR
jgi:hypothetical protein